MWVSFHCAGMCIIFLINGILISYKKTKPLYVCFSFLSWLGTHKCRKTKRIWNNCNNIRALFQKKFTETKYMWIHGGEPCKCCHSYCVILKLLRWKDKTNQGKQKVNKEQTEETENMSELTTRNHQNTDSLNSVAVRTSVLCFTQYICRISLIISVKIGIQWQRMNIPYRSDVFPHVFVLIPT